MGKRKTRGTRTPNTGRRMRFVAFRRAREARPGLVAQCKAIVDALTGTLTEQQRADAEADLATEPNDPQGTLL